MTSLAPAITDFLSQLQTALGSDNSAEALMTLEEPLEVLIELAGDEDYPGIADACALQLDLYVQLAEMDAASLQSAKQLLLRVPETLLALIRGEADSIDVIIDIFSNAVWLEPLAIEDLEFLVELLCDDCARGDLTESAIKIDDECAVPAAISSRPEFCTLDVELLDCDPNQVDAEVLTMLSESIRELVAETSASEEALGDCQRLAADLEPIIRAVNSVQLYAAQLLLSGLRTNLLYSAETHEPPTDWIGVTALAVSTYLERLADSGEGAELNDLVLRVFQQAPLPIQITPEQSDFVRQLMTIASVKASVVIQPETATSAHLQMPSASNVDAGLMAMLQDELPMLVESLLLALQQSSSGAESSVLMDAQRHAHTLKGLGNMAGLTALSHLTHRMEDILEVVCDAKVPLGATITEDLLEAADCLAQMVDALFEGSAQPELTASVLQSMMDWYYRIRTEGVEVAQSNVMVEAPSQNKAVDENETVLPPQESITSDVVEPASPATDDTQFRVPRVLIDDLFRIAGENTALTSQLSDELAELRGLTRTSRERHRQLQRLLSELEQHLNEEHTLPSHEDTELPDGTNSHHFDPLELDRYHEVHTRFSMLNETAADVREVDQQMATRVQRLNDLQIAQTSLQRETLDSVIRARQVPVRNLATRFDRIMRQACRTTEKQAELKIEGEDTSIDSQILNQLTSPLMHLIRNAVDHGIENPHLRFEAEKPETGVITLRFSQKQDRILIECEDDGAGIDAEVVRETAIRRGLIESDQRISDIEIQQLILLPGFSTRRDANQLSGRGIGLDVVHQEIRRLQGTLSIDAQLGRGTRFIISLPSSSLMIKSLLVRTAQQIYALPAGGLGQTILSLDGALVEEVIDQTNTLFFEYQSMRYRAYSLESFVDEPLIDYRQSSIFQVLLVETAHETVAVLVSEVIAIRELVFKRMGPYVPDITGIPGIALLTNGAVAPVLDLTARLQYVTGQDNFLSRLEQQLPVSELPSLLVVDDSLSTRKSLALLLRDAGFEVRTAIDGVDALQQIEKKAPHIVITDLEMPRMNGMELASSLANRASDVPIIMVTSRSTQKHYVEAMAAGVDVYLTKPWVEHELLDHVETLLHHSTNSQITSFNRTV